MTGSDSVSALADSGAGARSHETVWELTYRAQMNEHFALQPDVQFVQYPSATSSLDNAWVIGLRLQLAY